VGNFWTVDPTSNVDQIDLSYGGRDFTIWVRRDLTVGETRLVETAGFRKLTGIGNRAKATQAAAQKSAMTPEDDGMEIAIDWKLQSFARTATYLTDWTLADDAGNKLPLTRDTVESLRPEVYKVVEDAINEHVEARAKIRKNEQTGGEASRQISA
jgi:hypothetical protein